MGIFDAWDVRIKKRQLYLREYVEEINCVLFIR